MEYSLLYIHSDNSQTTARINSAGLNVPTIQAIARSEAVTAYNRNRTRVMLKAGKAFLNPDGTLDTIGAAY